MPLPSSVPKPSPQVRGGSIGSFRIDSKTFSFSFDDGRADSYAILESRRNFKNSVWLSHKGMKWVLSCFADIRDWVPGKDLLYKHYRENNKFFEFRGRSNKAGIFVDIAMFFGGAQRGSVMVPASSNRTGWCLFSKELDSFLAGSNTVGVEGRNSGGAAGGGQLYGGSHDGKKLFKTGNQREVRNFENSRAYLGHNVFKGETATVTVSKKKNGRRTHNFMFKVNS